MLSDINVCYIFFCLISWSIQLYNIGYGFHFIYKKCNQDWSHNILSHFLHIFRIIFTWWFKKKYIWATYSNNIIWKFMSNGKIIFWKKLIAKIKIRILSTYTSRQINGKIVHIIYKKLLVEGRKWIHIKLRFVNLASIWRTSNSLFHQY